MATIRGFKAIAAMLEELWQIPVTAKAAWRYSTSKCDPLPVTVVRNVVYADETKLLEWARRNCIQRGQVG